MNISKKIIYFLNRTLLVIAIVLLISNQTLALAPTKNISVLQAIEPLVHGGAGIQNILGPLLIGSSYEIISSGYSLQVLANRNENGSLIANPRPAIFNRSTSSLVNNSFFTVLQNSLFGGKMFVGFGKETYLAPGVDIIPTTTEWSQIKNALPTLPIVPQRLTVRGNILASNLNGINGNVTGQSYICVDANGTLMLCESKTPQVNISFDECSYTGSGGEVADSLGSVSGLSSNSGLLQTTNLSRIGRSLDFNGVTGSYVSTNSSTANTYTDIRPGEELSISVWVRLNASPAEGVNWITSKEGNCLGWYMRTETNGAIKTNLRIGTNCSSYTNWQMTSPPGTVSDGLWHQVVFTIDRVNHIMAQYVDGQRKGTVVLPPTGNSSGGVLRFGTNSDISGIFRDGSIDEFKTFNRILTDVDVRELFLVERTQTRSISCS